MAQDGQQLENERQAVLVGADPMVVYNAIGNGVSSWLGVCERNRRWLKIVMASNTCAYIAEFSLAKGMTI